MKFPRLKLGLLASLAFTLIFFGLMAHNPAFGAAVATNDYSPATYKLVGYAEATANQTFATTSYADVTGLSLTLTPTRNDPTASTNGKADLIAVSYTLQVSKATSTTGTCAVYANGAVVASTARTVNTAGVDETLSGRFIIANATVGAQTVKLQCKSGDTAALTVALGHMIVESIVRY